MQELRQSTGVTIRVGPIVNYADGVTPVTTLSLATADQAELLKHNGAAAVDISARTFVAVTGSDGWYDLTLTTADVDTLGDLVVVIQDANVSIPIPTRCAVVSQAYWDAKYGSGTLTAAAIRTEIDSNSTQLAAILTDTGTTIPAQITGLNDPTAATIASTVQSTLAADFAALPTAGEITADMDANSTQLAAIITDTGTTIPAQISGLNNFNPATDAVTTVTNVTNTVTVDTAGIVTAVWDKSLDFTGADNAAGHILNHLRYIDTAVYVDTTAVPAGDGSQQSPFNTVAAALDFAEAHGLKTVVALGDVTIDRAFRGYHVIGVGLPVININNQNVSGTRFVRCQMEGTYVEDIIVQDSVLAANFSLNGFFENCGIQGNLDCAASAFVLLKDCTSLLADPDSTLTVSMNNLTTSQLRVSGFAGNLTISDCNQVTDVASIEVLSGTVVLDSSNTNGKIEVGGSCTLTDSSGVGCVVTDSTIDATNIALTVETQLADDFAGITATVDTNAVAAAVWGTDTSTYGVGTAGYTLENMTATATVDNAAIAVAVWSEVTSTYTAGQAGYVLENLTAAVDTVAIADAVWGEDTSTYLAGTAGYALENVTASVDTGAIALAVETQLANEFTAIPGAVDTQLAASFAALPTAAEVTADIDANSTQLTAIALDTGTTIPGTLAGLSTFNPTTDTVATVTSVTNTVTVDTAAIAAAVDSTLVADFAAVNANIDANDVTADVTAIKAQTDQMVFTKANELDVNIKSQNNATLYGSGTDLDKWRGTP